MHLSAIAKSGWFVSKMFCFYNIPINLLFISFDKLLSILKIFIAFVSKYIYKSRNYYAMLLKHVFFYHVFTYITYICFVHSHGSCKVGNATSYIRGKVYIIWIIYFLHVPYTCCLLAKLDELSIIIETHLKYHTVENLSSNIRTFVNFLFIKYETKIKTRHHYGTKLNLFWSLDSVYVDLIL